MHLKVSTLARSQRQKCYTFSKFCILVSPEEIITKVDQTGKTTDKSNGNGDLFLDQAKRVLTYKRIIKSQFNYYPLVLLKAIN